LKYYAYVLRSIPTGRHYVGITSDLGRSLTEHNTKTGRWTSAFKLRELTALEESEDRKAESRREAFLKSREGIPERRKLFSGRDKFFEPSWLSWQTSVAEGHRSNPGHRLQFGVLPCRNTGKREQVLEGFING